ncbi:MAG: helix-turn-helix domain-containing protein [Myxococcaceae bacterium]
MPRHPESRKPPLLEGRLPAIRDVSGPLGIEIEAALESTTREWAGARPAFVLPLYSTVLSMESDDPWVPRVLDASHWLLMPLGVSVRWRCHSPVGTMLLLTPNPQLIRTVAETYAKEVELAGLQQSLKTVLAAPRTNWVNEVAQRYAFERSVCKKRNNAATAFLETELLKEWYFVRREHELRRPRTSHLRQHRDSIQKAQAWIDAHLHQRVTVSQIARAAHLSTRALSRAFDQQLGMGPATYLRARRLEDALLLLRGERYDVSEVAAQVGYGNLSAFSAAFHQRFGAPPSSFRRRSARSDR